jgi:two-component system cell cycle response regulator DivK
MTKQPILIVDDSPSNLKLIKILLPSSKYDLRTTTNAEETLQILKTFQPKLILMDIQLPGMNGLELTKKLRQDAKFHDVVILAITAYAMRGDEEKALAAGCDGYIPKPIDTRTLSDIIEKYIRSGRKSSTE